MTRFPVRKTTDQGRAARIHLSDRLGSGNTKQHLDANLGHGVRPFVDWIEFARNDEGDLIQLLVRAKKKDYASIGERFRNCQCTDFVLGPCFWCF